MTDFRQDSWIPQRHLSSGVARNFTRVSGVRSALRPPPGLCACIDAPRPCSLTLIEELATRGATIWCPPGSRTPNQRIKSRLEPVLACAALCCLTCSVQCGCPHRTSSNGQCCRVSRQNSRSLPTDSALCGLRLRDRNAELPIGASRLVLLPCGLSRAVRFRLPGSLRS